MQVHRHKPQKRKKKFIMNVTPKNNFKMKNIAIIALSICATISLFAQQKPAAKQSKSIVIIGATAHLGNGKVIENSIIAFKDGKITLVSNDQKTPIGGFDEAIDARSKHLYPGFIAPNSTLGLVEIDAVKSSDDEDEIGTFNPHIRSIIAYNTESRVIETVRPNGILMAQIAPRGGRIAGTSSIVQLDAWNWKDALLKENDGIHLDFPNTFSRSGWWAEPGSIESNKEYDKQVDDLKQFLHQSKIYLQEKSSERNLTFEAMDGLFDGNKTLYIHADEAKQITDGINLAIASGISKIAIVGGFEAYKVTELLKKNNVGVLLRRVHAMPMNDDQDVDLPYKLAKILSDNGILVGLENSGNMERMNTRNLPFLAGTCVAYGLEKEKALELITLNTAKILGIDAQCGSIEVGKDATLFLSDGDALDIRTNNLTKAFIQGRQVSLETHQTVLNNKFKEKYNQN
jgi:imidazolonepropionase-like amidohydrolase